MKKQVLLVLSAFAVLSTFAADEVKKPRVNRGELRRLSQMKQFGGFVMAPTSNKGKIVFADATGRCGEEIETVIKGLKRQLNVNIATAPCEKPTLANVAALQKTIGAECVVFVTDDAALPSLLAAPENRWSLVNVAGLAAGADEATAKRRIRCELARAYAYIVGAAASTHPDSVMTAITSPDQLDKLAEELPPLDVVARYQDYLERLGVTPMLMVPYRQACQEGWAAKPTNEWQQAIWDKAHQLPSAPLKLEK